MLGLRRWFPRKERSKGNSILLGGLYLGPIAAGPATALVIKYFGWHAAFYSFGLLGVLLGAAWWTWFRDDPKTHPLITAGEVAYIEADQDDETVVEHHGAFWRGLRSLQFWAVGLQYFFLILVQSFYTTWLPTYLSNVRHMSLAAMGINASLPWVALFIMVFVAGWLADVILRATGSVWLARVPAAMAGFVISAAALIAASRSERRGVDDGAALRIAGRNRAGAGFHLVGDAGSRPQRHRRGVGLDELLGQLGRLRGPGGDGIPGPLDRWLGRRAAWRRAGRRGRRGAVAAGASRAADSGPRQEPRGPPLRLRRGLSPVRAACVRPAGGL